jgi:hypothetical protein
LQPHVPAGHLLGLTAIATILNHLRRWKYFFYPPAGLVLVGLVRPSPKCEAIK